MSWDQAVPFSAEGLGPGEWGLGWLKHAAVPVRVTIIASAPPQVIRR